MLFSRLSKPLVHGSELCPELLNFLTEHKSDFEEKLIPDLSYIDDMAHVVNGIKIKDVLYINANQYRLQYSFDWELFLGCSDRNETGVENGSVLFTLEDDNVLNISFPNYGSRDTSDEL
ncbi:hypothetical protein EDB69_1012 [Vibrio crassostreae]|uniref:hypothetical protein n=1 Tax=Vibrio crassostreae TaxID=246167 RepID=UPI000F46FE4F|nr:hypothetical protein [Vibrio crassostreae]ROO75703.1 hypothetical protein EDB64_0682 [Vibrio crassostreae]ROP13710.1 hypothetical protein EDB63_0706 [Vibrio crassostreae]ROQ87799.1 hypothetical protein EDB72_1349 [Vibrio crassostreae]ROR87843.1 hypothetical protein EDB66_0781 [Vibrio crassostreae]RPE95051.1 hypothetical protein EDB68_1089 [Vibrio crassostreae]